MERADREALNEALARVAHGDRSAFDELFERAWPLVLGFSRRALPCAADAQDAAQEALLKVMRHAPRYDAARDATAWIVAIAANECRYLRRRRDRRRESALAPDHEVPARGPAPDGALLRAEAERWLGRAVESLGAADRDTLLQALGERPREPGLSPAAWRKRWQRVRERLRRTLERQNDET